MRAIGKLGTETRGATVGQWVQCVNKNRKKTKNSTGLAPQPSKTTEKISGKNELFETI
jgi:hypothetical protein